MARYVGGRIDAVAGINDEGQPQLANVDKDTGHFGVIDSSHAAVHEGRHFTMVDVDLDVDTGAPKYWHIKVPESSSSSSSGAAAECDEKEYHALFRASVSAAAIFEIFKDATVTDDGTPVAFINNDDNSAETTVLEGFADPTVDDDGTRVVVEVLGLGAGGPSGAGNARSDEERILKPGSYLIKVTALTDNTRVSTSVGVYEICEDVAAVSPLGS